MCLFAAAVLRLGGANSGFSRELIFLSAVIRAHHDVEDDEHRDKNRRHRRHVADAPQLGTGDEDA